MAKLDTVAWIRGSGTTYTEDKQITELRSQPNFGLDFSAYLLIWATAGKVPCCEWVTKRWPHLTCVCPPVFDMKTFSQYLEVGDSN